jgi:predicted site-specific integrase-resolvase
MKPPRRPGTKTVEQVAAIFGRDTRTIYRWRKGGLIKGIRDGNFWLFRDQEIERFSREHFDGLPTEQDQQIAS